MKKYIVEFNQTGISIANVDLICKDWNKKFSIYTWKTQDVVKYTLVVMKSKKIIDVKTEISEEQALQIVEKVNLYHVKDATFNSAGVYRLLSCIKDEAKKINELRLKKIEELSYINSCLKKYDPYYLGF